MNQQKEIELICQLLTHPAGYSIDNSGLICVRRYEHPMWAVEWENDYGKLDVKEFDNPLDAATFFINKRHKMKLGLDYGI